MAFDDDLYFREGALSGAIETTAFSTDVLTIDETPVGGLGINVVIPQVESEGSDGLAIDVYESDSTAWSTMVKFKTLPTMKTADSYWERFYSDKDYVACYVTIVSNAADSVSCDFGSCDIRLTDKFAKYAGT